MNTCPEYEELHLIWKEQIQALIKKMKGKSNIADISIDKSDLKSYDFKVTIIKFNSRKGWATIGYLRNDLFRGGIWRLTYQPRISKGEKSTDTGRSGSYG